MAREGIYVGSKEIIQRYVGTRLVWEKVKIQFNEITNFSSSRFGSFESYGNTTIDIDLGTSATWPSGLARNIQDANVIKLRNADLIFEVSVTLTRQTIGYYSGQNQYIHKLLVTFKNAEDQQLFLRNKYNETYIFGRKIGG